ncbi:MAG: putative arabinose efflux permease, family [Belnapia sp.]|nr:putative arabinose efflux permease, family [Belnapia sp.]
MKPAARLLLALVLMTSASQFHRAALGVIGPELATELGAGAGLLGAANGAFFLALLVLQIPVGLALDRIGPRLTVAALSLPAALGALGQGLAPDAGWFLAARFLLGLGCAASFMASVVLCARWHAGEGLTSALARVFAFSQLGILLAGAPFAWLAEALGWRGAYALSGLGTLVLAALWWVWVRDDPPDPDPGRLRPPRPVETIAGALRGQWTVWRTPGLLPVLAMHLVGYAAMATVLAVWAGPYLSAVHGLAPGPRGMVLGAMGLALVAGLLGVGPLERRLNTRKWLVVALASGVVLVLLALAAWPRAPLPVAIGLLVLLCGLSCYPVVVVAHGRSLFPDHLVGRGATTVNLAQTLGSAALPALTGWAVGYAPAELAWPIAFATLAAALALGVAGYLTGQDAPPRRPVAQQGG